jgi:formylglycine-generating enzyme required for sulfatase activity
VEVEPPEAALGITTGNATLSGSGARRTLTCPEPDGRAKVVLAAALPGYEGVTHELTPKAGDSGQIVLRLKRSQPDTAKEITNSIGMKLVLIPAGEFLMGSPDSDGTADDDEKPQHRVRITRPFYLGVTELTQEQYEQVMGSTPSGFQGDPKRPVEKVSWHDAVEFCRRLSQKEGKEYRLPTEAEWEYACRAGSTTGWCFGDNESELGQYAWYSGNSGRGTHPVGQKKPNAWGLYDMHGNVWEWCADWYGKDYYRTSPLDDPKGPDSGGDRVLRGGSWVSNARSARSASRTTLTPGNRLNLVGFRLARTP